MNKNNGMKRARVSELKKGKAHQNTHELKVEMKCGKIQFQHT